VEHVVELQQGRPVERAASAGSDGPAVPEAEVGGDGASGLLAHRPDVVAVPGGVVSPAHDACSGGWAARRL
jgi:hypothetical protein